MLDIQSSFGFDHSDTGTFIAPVEPVTTSKTLKALRESGEDFEWYPTSQSQIDTIKNDIGRLKEAYEISGRNEQPTILDIGAGDGRVVTALRDLLNEEKDKLDEPFKAYAVEKSTVHINSYRSKNISLIGTDFYETNLISKTADFAFVNPPYSDYAAWVARILEELDFTVLYAVIPQRWVDNKDIKAAMQNRGLEYSEILAESDFFDAERKARAKVHVVRFSFMDMSAEAVAEEMAAYEKRFQDRNRMFHPYRASLGINKTSPFLMFIDKELGLKKTNSTTTNEFNEHVERERIKREMNDETSETFEIVKSRGVLWALLEQYERDMTRTLEQYKLIGQLDGALLAELGVKHEDLVTGVRAKLLGFRRVYWSMLFNHLDVIKEKLTSENKTALLNELSQTALDITYTNAVYVISYAVDMGNELIEESLISVYKKLTSEESILRYYKSNERVFSDRWRYSQYEEGDPSRECKRVLDYRFIHSGSSNFSSYSWEHGINENTRQFTNDLIVVFRLLGYSNLHMSEAYENMEAGKAYLIRGNTPDGKTIDLLKIKYYLNGNRHLAFNQAAMLKFNVTISRILGWCRSKEDFADETDSKTMPTDEVWSISDTMKIQANNILSLTCQPQ